MSDFEKQLRSGLGGEIPFDPDLAAQQHKETLMSFEQITQQKLRTAKWIAWAGHAFYAMALLAGTALLLFEEHPKALLAGAMTFIAGTAGLVVIKLWYWMVHSRLLIVQEMKQLQLQVAELVASTRK